MAVHCSLLDRNSKQPTPFYKVNGEYFRNYSEAVKSAEEGQSIEVALLNTDSVTFAYSKEEMQSKIDGDVVVYDNTIKVNDNSVEKIVAKIPITFDTKTKDGVINTLISHDILSAETKNFEGRKYYFPIGGDVEAQTVNAVALENELTAMVGKSGYIREGNAFQILGREEIKLSKEGEVFFQMEEEANSATKEKPTLDTEETLTILLTNFLNEIGVDVVAIEEYKERYAKKHGVSPDAEGLADIANKVVALANRETINEEVITEEVAHFIVEGMSETESLLDDVVGTEEWNKHSDRYRQIYGESISDPVELENAVKKEVLGKILAKSIREDYNAETNRDASFFDRVWNALVNFLDRLTKRAKPEHSQRVKDFTKRVGVLLHNKQLAEVIENERLFGSKLPPMYALSENSPIRKTTEALERTLKNAVSNTNREYVRQLESGIYSKMEEAIKDLANIKEDGTEETELLANVSMLTEIANTQISAMLTELSRMKEGDILPQEISSRFNTIQELVMNPLLEVKSKMIFEDKFNDNSSMKKVVEHIETTFSKFGTLKGGLESKRKLSEDAQVERIAKDVGRDDEGFKNQIKKWLSGVFKEQGFLQTFFGTAMNSSNPYVKRIGMIAFNNYTKTLNYMNKEVKPILARLEKNRARLKEIVNKEAGELLGHFNGKVREVKRKEKLKGVAESLFNKYIKSHPHFKDLVFTEEDYAFLDEKNYSQYAFEDLVKDKMSLRVQDLYKNLSPAEYTRIDILKDGEADFNEQGLKLMDTVFTDYSYETAKVNNSLKRQDLPSVLRMKEKFKIFENGFGGYIPNKNVFKYEQDLSQRRGDIYKKIPKDKNGHIDGGNPAVERYDHDLQSIKRERIEAKSVFTKSGDLKKGFSAYRTKRPLNKGEYLYEVNDNVVYVFDSNNASKEAETAYGLYIIDKNAQDQNEQRKAQGLPPLFPEGDMDFLTERLEEYMETLPSTLSEKEMNKRVYEWFKRNASISFTDSYYNQFDGLGGFRQNVLGFLNQISQINDTDKNTILSALQKIEENKANIRHVLNTAKSFLDFREINPNFLDSQAKSLIEKLEKENKRLRDEIKTVLNENASKDDVFNIESGGTQIDMMTFFNNAFYTQFKSEYGVDFENASKSQQTEWITNIHNGSLDNYYTAKARWSKILVGTGPIAVTPEVKKKLGKYFVLQDENFVTQEDVDNNLQMILLQGVPAYWKRTTPEAYNELNRQLETGEINVLNDVIRGNSLGPFMKVKPSYSMVEEDTEVFKLGEHLFNKKMEQIESKNYTSKSEKLRDMYEAYMHIAGRDYVNINKDEVSKEFLDKFGMTVKEEGTQIKFTPPTKNIELFESLIDCMELNRKALKDYKEINNISIFRLPQNRASGLQRIAQGSLKSYGEEWVQSLTVREDDEADGIKLKSRKSDIASSMFVIPRQGLARIPVEEVSTDLMWSFAKFARDGREYRNRKDSIDEAVATRESISNIQFSKGQYYKDTRDYKMATNVINAQFLGQNPVYEAEIKLPNGKKIDMAKVAHRYRKYVSATNLMFSPLVALTSGATASLNKALARASNYNLFSPASTRADMEFGKLFTGGVTDAGKNISSSVIDTLGEYAGLYDVLQRTENAQFGFKKNLLDVEKLGYSIHSMANYIISPRVMLSKLMEYRVVTDPEIEADGVLMSWSNFLERKKMANPKLSKTEIQRMFEAKANNSLYDLIEVENGVAKINYEKAKAMGVKSENIEEYFDNLQERVARDVQSAISLYDGVIHQSQTPEGQRHPLATFLFLHRAWFVIASEKMFGSGGFNLSTGNFENSVFHSMKKLFLESVSTKDPITGKLKFQFNKEAWNNLTEAQKSANRYILANTITVAGLVFLASAMMGWADDDEDSYLSQMLATLSLRTLNETVSATLGLPSEYYSFLNSPVVAVNSIQNTFNLVKVWQMNEEVTKGMYAGRNKWVTNAFKLTFFKNMYMFQDPAYIAENRKGMLFFSDQQGLYNFTSIAKYLAKDEE